MKSYSSYMNEATDAQMKKRKDLFSSVKPHKFWKTVDQDIDDFELYLSTKVKKHQAVLIIEFLDNGRMIFTWSVESGKDVLMSDTVSDNYKNHKTVERWIDQITKKIQKELSSL